MKLSIIIVSWNTSDLLAKCLASIYSHPPGCQFEVLIVDNNSTDNSVEMVRQQFPQVILFPNKHNIGFAPANNQAIRQSSGQYTLLLNPDTEVHAGTLETLVNFLDENSAVGAVGPLTLNPDSSLQTSCYPLPTLAREFWRLFHLDKFYPYGSYNMSKWDRNTKRQVDALLGACLMVRKTIMDEIGLLDEDYFIYSEEIDLCYRVQKAGWTLYWVPQAQIIHYGGQSTKQVAAEMFLRLYQGKVLYFQKHYSWLTVQLYKIIIMAASLPRLLMSLFAWLEKPPKRQQHLALASNYRRLFMAVFWM
jgi:GT2 family glycosyltransferase